MKFIDECKLKIKAGKGGDGIISFLRELKVAFGGPAGGDGGRGGDIMFKGSHDLNTLVHLANMHHIRGKHGEHGRSKNKHGAMGEATIIRVPIGTIVYNGKEVIAEVLDEKEYLIAKGGKGGKGNARFKSSINRAPRICENGLPGEEFEARIELQLLADVGFVGLPSAGKSSLLSILTNAKPKIASYDFTTLTPQLGISKIRDDKSLVLADLPGLIEGAAHGKGLGYSFLRHINRCRVIAHVIDLGTNTCDHDYAWTTINNELKEYSLKLEKRPQILIATKSDLPDFEKNYQTFSEHHPNLTIVPVSSLTYQNIQAVKDALWKLYIGSAPIIEETDDDSLYISLDHEKIEVKKVGEHRFKVSGKPVKRILDLIPRTTFANINRFNHKLKKLGVWKQLTDLNIQDGDDVIMFKYIFVWGQDNE